MVSSNTTPKPRAERRRVIATRNAIKLAARLADEAGDGKDALILNISATGVLLQTARNLAVGETVRVDLAAAGRHAAKVMWAIDGMVGCQFLHPLARSSLSAALLKGEALALPPRDGIVGRPDADPSVREKNRLGLSIAFARKAKGMRQGDLGIAIGVSTTTICKWEQGHVRPRAKALTRLEDCLGRLGPSKDSNDDAQPLKSAEPGAIFGGVLSECKLTIAHALGLDPKTIGLKVALDLTI